jgi:hypothetical protein
MDCSGSPASFQTAVDTCILNTHRIWPPATQNYMAAEALRCVADNSLNSMFNHWKACPDTQYALKDRAALATQVQTCLDRDTPTSTDDEAQAKRAIALAKCMFPTAPFQ